MSDIQCHLLNVADDGPPNDLPPYGEDFAYKLELDGIIPITAHPEKNRSLMKISGF